LRIKIIAQKQVNKQLEKREYFHSGVRRGRAKNLEEWGSLPYRRSQSSIAASSME
jgi:hypothetical protein